jgi:hypothetical protein
VAPYGSWKSPITAQTVAAGSLRLGGIVLDGDDLYWLEGRPDEGGRVVLVKRSPDGRIADATPAATNVRTRVHEYGGAAYVVSRGTIYFSEFSDQRLYRLTPGSPPAPLTPPGDWFYADACINASATRLVCVREDHRSTGRRAPAKSSCRATISIRRRDSARTAPACLGLPGITRACPGTARNSGSRTWPPTARWNSRDS